ncbi:hypothetical protein C8Q77DRAFT_731658 [Trametes polyzona]|nr:hypothetical protein C8Q77DRAFT_731658 [Trametes polyzona]
MPSLRSLTIRVNQTKEVTRPLISADSAAFAGIVAQLRSLTLVYPHPSDRIFDVLTDNLTRLSLRDSPRRYLQRRFAYAGNTSVAPLLTASECLSILKRVVAPRLAVLEIVYEADETEDSLLRYICEAFPLLRELEVHRYRCEDDLDNEVAVPYVHIARLVVTGLPRLQALFLNFDIRDSNIDPWLNLHAMVAANEIARRRGLDLVDMLSGINESLEYVAVLRHRGEGGRWQVFYPEGLRRLCYSCWPHEEDGIVYAYSGRMR